jgi:hypothetical protein
VEARTHAPRARLAIGRAAALAAALASAILVGGCGSNDPSFLVTEPRELLSKVVDRMVALQRVHLEAQLAEPGGLLGGPDGGALQADLDIANGELSLAAKSTEAAAGPVGVVIADGSVFTLNGGVWDVTPLADAVSSGPLAMLPARERLIELLRAIAADQRVGLERRDPVECSTGRCYALVVTAPMIVLWEHLGPIARPALGLPDVLPGDVPPVNLLLYAHPTTFDLVRAELVYAPSGGRVRLVVDLRGHDQPMQIQPPG